MLTHIVLRMASKALRADTSQSGRDATAAARARPVTIIAFQLTSTLSSRPGRGRSSRVASSLARVARRMSSMAC
jgi:hypothetical protein